MQLKCTSSELQEHFIQVESLLRQLEWAEEKLDGSDKVCNLLLTMHEKYDIVITVIETLTKNVALEFVKDRLLDTEFKYKDTQPDFKRQYSTVRSSKAVWNVMVVKVVSSWKNCPKKDNMKKGTFRGNYRSSGGRNFHKGSTRQTNYASDVETNKTKVSSLQISNMYVK